MTQIILVRHCEAEGNAKRIFQGHTDAPISENGRVQLDLLRQRLHAVPIEVIYSSPLQRAYQTAEAIHSFREIPIEIKEDLMEINGGDWEGHYWKDLVTLFPEDCKLWVEQPHLFAPNRGEPMQHVFDRMQRSIIDIVTKHAKKTICVVSHGCAIRNLLCWAMGKTIEQLNDIDWCDNTAVSVIQFDDRLRPLIVFANDASHLTRETSTLANQTWWIRSDERGSFYEDFGN